MVWVQHNYNQKEGWMNLLGANNPILSRVFYHHFSKVTKKSFISLYLFKTWGPPYGKVKKTFKETPGSKPKKTDSKHLEPTKKEASH